MKVGTIFSGLNFGRLAPPGRGSSAGRKFWPYYNQRGIFASMAGLHLSDRFFHFICLWSR